MNDNLSALPLDAQPRTLAALRERWHSAFFELIVARILQELGAVIAIENTTSAGSRPDFTADFEDGRVAVEAVSPIVNAATGEVAKRRLPLLNIIESHIPSGWRVAVWELPDIGPTDSNREFERSIAAMLAVEPPSDMITPLDLVQESPTGTIHLQLWPNGTGVRDQQLAIEPPLTAWDNSEQRIRYAVRKKRRQVRASDAPVLLAVQASGISSEYDDFDKAVYGRSVGRPNITGQIVETWFSADGEFTKKKDGSPTYAGVLAFLDVGPISVTGPILYPHPRFQGNLPKAFSDLERRWYDSSAAAILHNPAKNTSYVSGLRLVTHVR